MSTLVMRKGRLFDVEYLPDYDSGYPWENCDGHGPVRRTLKAHGSRGDKQPGERPLNRPGCREYQFYYDWQEACKKARAEGWNTEPYDAPNKVQRAVQADFDFLRAYLNNEWSYVTVHVSLLMEDENGEMRVAMDEYLGGVETYNNYHEDVAMDLTLELLAREVT